jgi:hypothetical protein
LRRQEDRDVVFLANGDGIDISNARVESLKLLNSCFVFLGDLIETIFLPDNIDKRCILPSSRELNDLARIGVVVGSDLWIQGLNGEEIKAELLCDFAQVVTLLYGVGLSGDINRLADIDVAWINVTVRSLDSCKIKAKILSDDKNSLTSFGPILRSSRNGFFGVIDRCVRARCLAIIEIQIVELTIVGALVAIAGFSGLNDYTAVIAIAVLGVVEVTSTGIIVVDAVLIEGVLDGNRQGSINSLTLGDSVLARGHRVSLRIEDASIVEVE